MNKEVKEKWITALRSGEYKQGREALKRTDNEFCCLGVLCDLYIKETGIGRWVNDKSTYVDFWIGDKYSGAMPLEEVKDWAGLSNKGMNIHTTDVLLYNNFPRTLAGLNDTQRLSFLQIADIIEEQL